MKNPYQKDSNFQKIHNFQKNLKEMNENLQQQWDSIRKHFRESFSTNLHVSIATVDEHQFPTITPIGSLFLNRDQTGFYFEIFSSNIRANGKKNKNVCVLAVNSGKWFWIKALFQGKFGSYPAIKLYGTLGERRKASEIEISRLRRRFKRFKGTKGYNFLWVNAPFVREIHFEKAEPARVGKMTQHLPILSFAPWNKV